jgi:hypothetical protein
VRASPTVWRFLAPSPFLQLLFVSRISSRSLSCPLTDLRRRPLNCGYVPRLCQHTGVVCRPSIPFSKHFAESPYTDVNLAFGRGLAHQSPRYRHVSFLLSLIYICFHTHSTHPPQHLSRQDMASDQRHTHDPVHPTLRFRFRHFISPFTFPLRPRRRLHVRRV